MSTTMELDAAIIGAGFSGTLLLHKLRDELKLNTKVFEASSSLGGVWQQNRYPGARVDCPIPGYEFSNEKVWKTWTWSEKYPGQEELYAYFQHVDQELSLSKECFFNARVTSARFLPELCKWRIQTEDGRTAIAKYLIAAVGFASKQYTPNWKGLETFGGTIVHSSNWPREGVDLQGKKIAVIGTGATGVQLVQECGKQAAETIVFQRTPNMSLPMRQQKLGPAALADPETRRAGFKDLLQTHTGTSWVPIPRNTFDDSPEEREANYERLYQEGGFAFVVGNYQDTAINAAANREAYSFWAKKTRERIHDPRLQDLLAPLTQPHPLGAKRLPLEQDYYEQFNKSNVHLINLRENGIKELQPNGIVTDDGQLHQVDIIAIATGFDAVTGGMRDVGIEDKNGIRLSTRWERGVCTHLGMMVSDCPNLFLPYSAQSPSVLSSGPVSIEIQGNWITDVIRTMETKGILTLSPKKEAEQAWRNEVLGIADMTLFPAAESWYMGANIPGKRKESLFYMGGLPLYQKRCSHALANDLSDFEQITSANQMGQGFPAL